jgi:PD-(D/E)XK nuclease superfamily
VETQPLPRVTPYLLRRADAMCARRLSRAFEGGERSHDPVHRSRLRDAFLAAVRDVHAELAVPTAADFADVGDRLDPAVLPEERAVLEQAGRWYVAMFGDRPARWDDPGTDQPTDRGGLRVGGWIDLPLRTADDGFELRQFELWGRRVPPSDPLELEALRVAFLRLTPWLDGAPARVAWADLVRGLLVERVIEPDERPAVTKWFDERVTIVRERADDPIARTGSDCGGCAVVAGCPEHRKGAHYGRKADLLPGILHVTPTGLDTWRRCAREWRDHQLFGIPASDTDPGGVHGQQLHDALHMIHVEGSCHDLEHVGDVLVRRGLDHDDRLWGEIERHTVRCPSPSEAVGHEITRARFSSHPTTPFMATARIDALWVHDGLLDARDFKSGQVWSERVADDKQARLQAWILAPLAAARGLRLRIAFEHLAPEVVDDPEPFEPDADDLAAIEDDVRREVAEIRTTNEFVGVNDPEVCKHCRYRSICPDSALPGVPVWPTVDAEDDA